MNFLLLKKKKVKQLEMLEKQHLTGSGRTNAVEALEEAGRALERLLQRPRLAAEARVPIQTKAREPRLDVASDMIAVALERDWTRSIG